MIIAHELKFLDRRPDARWSVAHFEDGSVCGLPTEALPDDVRVGAEVVLVLRRDELVAVMLDGQWVVDMDRHPWVDDERIVAPQLEPAPEPAPAPGGVTGSDDLGQLWSTVRQAARSTVRARLQRWAAGL
jgi:hypothetical protein